MALVPNAWGLWNLLYLWLSRGRRMPIGIFGSALVVVIAPIAFAIQLAPGKAIWTAELFAIGFPIALVV